MSQIRKTAVAGMFYPESAKKLKMQILAFLNNTKSADISGQITGLVVPHAGYIYSGQVAANAYKLLETGKYDTAIILGPNHHGAGESMTSVYAEGAFETPLGSVNIDQEIAQDILSSHSSASFDVFAHSEEHSLEVQIPFLQIVKQKIQIVPIVMADYGKEECEKLACSIVESILKRKDKKIVIVASSDFSHYHPYDEAVRLDRLAIRLIENMDVQELYRQGNKNRYIELCGFGPVLTMMLISKELGANAVKTLYYANSGDVTGDRSQVVGYAAMAIYKKL